MVNLFGIYDMSFQALVIWSVVILTIILWRTKVSIFGFTFIPLGISTNKFNIQIRRFALQHKSSWIKLGRISHRVLQRLLKWGIILVFASYFIGFLGYLVLNLFGTPEIPKSAAILQDLWLSFWSWYTIDSSHPLYYVIILISFFLHELLHGVVAEAYDVKISKIGAGLIPGFLSFAYVGIDDDDLKNDPALRKKHPIRNYNRRLDLVQQQMNSGLYAKIGRIASVGLVGNLCLVLIGSVVMLCGSFLSYGIVYFLGQQVITINLALFGLNIIPFAMFDGRKILSPYKSLPDYDNLPSVYPDEIQTTTVHS